MEYIKGSLLWFLPESALEEHSSLKLGDKEIETVAETQPISKSECEGKKMKN